MNAPCPAPLFYTPATGLAFDNQGYLSAIDTWRQTAGYEKRGLPLWPVEQTKIYPVRDLTPNYYPLYDPNPTNINVMVSSTQNWYPPVLRR